ncbi:MAG: helix-turn-helix domain-containing protein [Prevotellaceae bacterium]|jgi:DNA invertase Pin-like site-specific DNA recombinase|nr:helix-turn-helix domain-containing protein [Prevotellaceae bacterium]
MENIHIIKEDELNSVIDNAVKERVNAEYNKFYNTFIYPENIAKMHNVSRQTIINYINDGLIPTEPHNEGEHYKIRMSEALKLDFSKLKKQLKLKK